MSTLGFTQVDRAQLALQQQLDHCRRHYPFAGGLATLSLEPRPASVDCSLWVEWRGVALKLHCHSVLLAAWLSPNLQEAAFSSLPCALQLALLQRVAGVLPDLICSHIERSRADVTEYNLCLTLTDDGRRLPLWIEGDGPSLLKQLPARPPSEWHPLTLQLSLQWPSLQLPCAQLRTLACGDILLFAPATLLDGKLFGYLQGRRWAELTLNNAELEIITMLDNALAEPAYDLTDLNQLEVQVGFEVGRQSLDLHTLASLGPGSLIDLAAPLNGEVRILVNQRCIGSGELVNIQDRLGVRILRLLPGSPA
ncbi:type III secretion system cytoplasmic ring protein SctQ [Pseudomonas fontis]|uniref:Type III secretion system cytoplasmic ring protein SctQ n=1 Tax=Pseudomonas fontis TaxID=2942633 RepID=A0ABT5P059_9PSED|nr:type III secretion system cytoplasmic ring protein SctQ [Pseudomonas fontis]MDD0976390.1 type III secretion system cytoplasmic ring protein SctQ [Pseudomonas fontis]MDD0993724.1 type III secretion system cytoplasmic ring protein SctQ [Pseudomonas fontis]